MPSGACWRAGVKKEDADELEYFVDKFCPEKRKRKMQYFLKRLKGVLP
jgi:hypothetical protein